MSKAEQILAGLGGADNIVEIEACITRLRTEVRDGSLVDQAALKAAGAHGVMASGTIVQVVVGPETGREIRFVRSPNTGDTDVTFGRSEGPPHRHVQLLVPTVSRRHALMSLLDEHWSLQNLSATNPVTLNGRRLAPDEVVPLLVDGDRIEMGEVVFVFHGR